MENSLSPLLPAFNLLWRAALKENSERSVNVNKGNGNCTVSKQQPFSPAVKSGFPKMQNQITGISSSDESNSNTTNDETVVESVVVCILECDHGAKFIRQIIHEGTQKSEWSRAEDLFVDWLNCELMSKQAQRIDATMYFSHIPINTCSYGLCLWLQNLREVVSNTEHNWNFGYWCPPKIEANKHTIGLWGLRKGVHRYKRTFLSKSLSTMTRTDRNSLPGFCVCIYQHILTV